MKFIAEHTQNVVALWSSIVNSSCINHNLDGIGFEQLRVASSTSPGQEQFSVEELSPWLVHVSGTLFHKTLEISQTEKLLNELLRHIILN